jgi:RNA polymerase sigma-70 factor (ECF subfamily)
MIIGGRQSTDDPRGVAETGCAPPAQGEAEDLLGAVGKGDESAFARLYDLVTPRVLGLTRRVLRDLGQAEEVTQEIFVEVWRKSPTFDPAKGSALSWILTIAHRRAVDRVRHVQAGADRERRFAATSETPYDAVSEDVTANAERQQVRECLESLTELQREAVMLAYYQGYTYREVAELLGTSLPTIKTRMRDGLIRMRDCMRDEREGVRR